MSGRGLVFASFTLRGHGLSTGILGANSENVEDVVSFRKYMLLRFDEIIDPDRVTILGFSLGGMVSLDTIRTHPDLFHNMVVLSPLVDILALRKDYVQPFQKTLILSLLNIITGTRVGDAYNEFRKTWKELNFHSDIYFAQATNTGEGSGLGKPVFYFVQSVDGLVLTQDIVRSFHSNTDTHSTLHIANLAHSTLEIFSSKLHENIVDWILTLYQDPLSVPSVKTVNYMMYSLYNSTLYCQTDVPMDLSPTHMFVSPRPITVISHWPVCVDVGILSTITQYLHGTDCVLPMMCWDTLGIMYEHIHTVHAGEMLMFTDSPKVSIDVDFTDDALHLYVYILAYQRPRWKILSSGVFSCYKRQKHQRYEVDMTFPHYPILRNHHDLYITYSLSSTLNIPILEPARAYSWFHTTQEHVHLQNVSVNLTTATLTI
jgi:hypothetical protein